MGKAGLAVVLVIVLIGGAVYVAGLGDDLARITGNAVKALTGDKIDQLKNAEKDAENKLGNTIGDDKIRINLTNPLTGDAIEYSCEKGIT
jgi:Sec-independent protein translocase protein TatA